jgi:hypothetical protein
MSSLPSSTGDVSPSCDSDTESSTTNYGHVDDEPAHISYRDGILAWGSSELKDENIIVVARVDGVLAI